MSNSFSVDFLVGLGAEKVARIAKSAGATPSVKDACRKALEQLGEDLNGDGIKDENDYPDFVGFTIDEYRALLNEANPTRAEDAKQQGQDETKANMKTGGEVEEDTHEGAANRGAAASYALSGITTGLTAIQGLNTVQNLTDEAEKAKAAAGQVKFGAIAALGVAALDVGVDTALNVTANKWNHGNLNGDGVSDVQSGPYTEYQDEIDTAVEQMEEDQEEAANLQEEVEETTEETNKETEDLALQSADNLAVIVGLQKLIENGQATDSEKKLYEKLIGEISINNDDIGAYVAENFEFNDESAARIAELLEGMDVHTENINKILGSLQVYAEVADKTMKNIQGTQEASAKLGEISGQQVTVGYGNAGKDAVMGAAALTHWFAGGTFEAAMYFAAAATEGVGAVESNHAKHSYVDVTQDQMQKGAIVQQGMSDIATTTAGTNEALGINTEGIENITDSMDHVENAESKVPNTTSVSEFKNTSQTNSEDDNDVDSDNDDDKDKDKNKVKK